MRRIYIRRRGFWIRRKLLALLRFILAAVAVAVSLVLTVLILFGLLLWGGG